MATVAASVGGNCGRCTACGGDGVAGISCQAGQRFRTEINTGMGLFLLLGGDLERNDLLRSGMVVRFRHACLDIPCALGVRGIPRFVCAALLLTVSVSKRSEYGRCGGAGGFSEHDVGAGQVGDVVAGLGDGEFRRLTVGKIAAAGDGQSVRPAFVCWLLDTV